MGVLARSAVVVATMAAGLAGAAVDPAGAWTLPTVIVEQSSGPHDLVVDQERGLAYLSLPSEDVVVALDAEHLTEQERWPVGDAPRGMDLLADGDTLVVALGGVGSVAFVDLDMGTVTTRSLLDELGDHRTWDVKEVQPGRLLVTASPGSSSFASAVQLVLATDEASVVGDDETFRSSPRITVDVGGTAAYISETHIPQSIYKLDLSQADAPIVAEDDHGSVGGTETMVATADGVHLHTSTGLLVRMSDLGVSGTVPAGMPVEQADRDQVWVLRDGRLQAFVTATDERLGSVGLACPLEPDFNVHDRSTDRLWILSGTTICVTDLDGDPFLPRPTPDPAGDAGSGVDVVSVRESATPTRVVYAVRTAAPVPRDEGIFIGLDLDLDRNDIDAIVAIDVNESGAAFFCGDNENAVPLDIVRVDALEVRVGFPRAQLTGCGLPRPMFEYGVLTGPFGEEGIDDELPDGIGLVGTIGIVQDLDARNPSTAFVRALFADFLGRTPDADGSDFWTYRADLGPNRFGVALSFASSDEWIGVTVDQLYLTTLGRGPDPAGRSHWIGRIRAGLSVPRAGGFFYGSDEYFQSAGGTAEDWVIELYEDVLGRTPDQAGLDYWVGRHDAGVLRDVIGESFFQSVESRRQRVTALYLKLLGRGTDPAGLAFWAERILVHGDLSLAASLAGSDEYFAQAQSG